MQAVLQLVGAVEEDSLFRLCDTIVDRDTAGALVFVEELAEQGQDLGRLVTDLLEHLRHLLLVQHMGHVPESLPVTEETRERLREQANQLPEPTVLRLIRPARGRRRGHAPGRRPRLPLELALVKVTRPHATSRASRSPTGSSCSSSAPVGAARARGCAAAAPRDEAGSADTPQRHSPRRGRRRPSRRRRSRSSRSRTRGSAASSPPCSALDPGRLAARRGPPGRARGRHADARVPRGADFHRRQAEEPKNIGVLRDALYEVTAAGSPSCSPSASVRRLAEEEEDDELAEDDLISLLKDTFDAEEVEETR